MLSAASLQDMTVAIMIENVKTVFFILLFIIILNIKLKNQR